jgi:hypothetical protein
MCRDANRSQPFVTVGARHVLSQNATSAFCRIFKGTVDALDRPPQLAIRLRDISNKCVAARTAHCNEQNRNRPLRQVFFLSSVVSGFGETLI